MFLKYLACEDAIIAYTLQLHRGKSNSNKSRNYSALQFSMAFGGYGTIQKAKDCRD